MSKVQFVSGQGKLGRLSELANRAFAEREERPVIQDFQENPDFGFGRNEVFHKISTFYEFTKSCPLE